VIGGACVDVMDKSCVQECPVDCIYEGARVLYINPDECVDCGACKSACRVGAIYYEIDLPEDERQHLGDNAAFFRDALPGRAVLADHAEDFVRAAVSAATRQPGVRRLSVTVEVGDELLIKLAADGQGVPDEATTKNFAEMRCIAEEIGGSLTVETGPDSETILRWSVPFPE